jgi:S1-C subfamily serine protease
VITQVNGEAVTTVAEYRKAVSKLKPGQDVVFKVLRRQDSDRILTLYLSGRVPSDNQQ